MGKKEKKDDIECNVCGKTYKSLSWYNKHMKSAHPSSGIADVPSTATASSSAGGQSTDVTSNTDSIPSSSQPTTSSSGNPDEGDEDDDDDEAAEIAAAEKLDWGDWSGTDEEEDIESYLVMEPWREEEEEEARRANQAGKVNVDVSPKRTHPPALVNCHLCKTTFSTLDGYIKHLVGHGMEAALLRIPTKEQLYEECHSLGRAVLQDMKDSKLAHGPAKKVADLALDIDLEWNSDEMLLFVTHIFDRLYTFFESDRLFSLPSILVTEYMKHSACVIVDLSLRSTLKEIVTKKTECGDVESNIFVANFVSNFSSKLLAHLLRVLRKGTDRVNLEDRYAQTHQSTVSLDFKQNIHYIGGSNVKSFLKKALRIKHRNDEWKKVINVVRNNFLISEFSQAPEAELMAWTDALDRGKLTKISAKALDFFLQLGIEVKPLERLDGSLITDEVIQKITQSAPLLLRWDELKGPLNEAESFKLLHALTYHFCVTWRNGVIGRRHDEMAAAKEAQKFGTGGVAFRARLGGKK